MFPGGADLNVRIKIALVLVVMLGVLILGGCTPGGG